MAAKKTHSHEHGELCSKINKATNSIAKCVESHIENIKVEMTPAEVEAVQEGLKEDVARLQSLCCDPSDPCPVA